MHWSTIETPFSSVHLLPLSANVAEQEILKGASKETLARASEMKVSLRRLEFLRSRWLYQAVTQQATDPVKNPDGDLDWPIGYSGSMSHKDGHVVLMLAELDEFKMSIPPIFIGVDIERSSANLGISEKIATPDEWARFGHDFSRYDGSAQTAIFFSAKEAIFKAVFPAFRKMFWFDGAIYQNCETRQNGFLLNFILCPEVVQASKGVDKFFSSLSIQVLCQDVQLDAKMYYLSSACFSIPTDNG